MQPTSISLGCLIGVVILSVSSAESYSNHSRNLDYLRSEVVSLKRQARFVKFQTLGDDLKVLLEFIVPFFSVPVKRTMDDASSMAKGFMNINVGALVLTGITIIAGVSTAAALSHLARMANGRMKAMRSSDILDDISAFSFGEKEVHNEKSESPMHDIFTNIDTIFREFNIDLSTCIQKTTCLLVKESTQRVAQGKGTNINKIIDGVTSAHWISTFLSGTKMGEAIDIGRSNDDCSSRHTTCNWSDNSIKDFIDSM